MPPATRPPRWVILYPTIHAVLAAERAFKAAGVWLDVIPTPKALSADCGMSLEVRPADRERLAPLLADPHNPPSGLFECPGENQEWQPVIGLP